MVRSFYSNDFLYSGGERAFVEALNSIEYALAEHNLNNNNKNNIIENNNIFITLLPELEVSLDSLEEYLKLLWERYSMVIQKTKIGKLEYKIKAKCSETESFNVMLFIISNPTGLALKLESYVEVYDPKQKISSYTSISKSMHIISELDSKEITTPYLCQEQFEKQRIAAKAANTIYCYDFIELLIQGLNDLWAQYARENPVIIPHTLLIAKELILDYSANPPRIKEVSRFAGHNDIAMVAWKITMYSPAFRAGREIILISNDITINAGSFGTQEDLLFHLCTELAIEKGCPRIFFASNSGARIGLSEELKRHFYVEWKDDSNSLSGFNYLYIKPEQFNELSPYTITEPIYKNGEIIHYKLLSIIGRESDLGVENLQGSGMIAGDTSRAYKEIFTLTYVSSRSVGIGAYLIRLGQRTIQKIKDAPIILTGYQALNQLMGKTVYSSNHQLGGPHIMYPNGISHLLVNDDYQGMVQVLNWLEYIPQTVKHQLPILFPSNNTEVINRLIEFQPQKEPYDVRQLIAGYEDILLNSNTVHFISGFFDKNTFIETLAGWAKTVVCGRARLGGIPCGVIATENRTVEMVIPADPAIPESQEQHIQQAGCVWFPDSAFKTATAIQDFNYEGLPLFIFANWRGFSGGGRDMFEEVLKFGASIVDALVDFKNPIFIYLPDYSELRGGAWAVLDPLINPDMMEMYVSDKSRAGVLEPSGVVEIKYKKDFLKTCHRLDPVLQKIDEKILKCTEKEKEGLLKEKVNRERLIHNLYMQIAETFADLHDTPGRMMAKKVINDIIEWPRSRIYFYYRLRRKLKEIEVIKQIKTKMPKLTNKEIKEMILKWYLEKNNNDEWNDNKLVYNWLDSTVLAQKINSLDNDTNKNYIKLSHLEEKMDFIKPVAKLK